jgi:hypothetical protein
MTDFQNTENVDELVEQIKLLRLALIHFKTFDPTGYIFSRFILKNYELSENDFVQKFLDDKSSRDETERKENHRKNVVIDDVGNWSDDYKQQLLIKLTGNDVQSSTSTVNNEVQ